MSTQATGGVSAERTPIRLYDERDLVWIALIVDHVVAAVGQPWRMLRERLAHSALPSSKVELILRALHRITGGRVARTKIARQVRELVLGVPALDDVERRVRLERASASLGLPVEEVAELLWIDLAEERPVALPEGRPDERRLAAYANLERLQRIVRRAQHLELRVGGDAHELVRAAQRFGLLTAVRREWGAHELTVIEVIGPLQLFHATSVYGRALASLVPLLALHDDLELLIDSDFGYGLAQFRVESPLWLPEVPPAGTASSTPARRLARDLAKHDVPCVLEPPPIESGEHLLFPDLALDVRGRPWLVEVVGFATAEFLTRRRAAYRAAGIEDVVLAAAARDGLGEDDDPSTLRYDRRVDVEALLQRVDRG